MRLVRERTYGHILIDNGVEFMLSGTSLIVPFLSCLSTAVVVISKEQAHFGTSAQTLAHLNEQQQ